jgi:cell division protein FtsN
VARYAVLAVALVVAVGAGWFGVRAFMTRPAASPPATTAPAASAPAVPAAVPDKLPAVVPPPGPAPDTAAQAPAPVPAVPLTASREPAPPAPGATAAGAAERFDIVVASFRTESRAASVSEQVTALGLPLHRRVTDGWQQVMAGPFASRTAAAAAQQQLERAGLTGTQIVPAGR